MFVHSLHPEVLSDLAMELNRDGRWNDFVALCCQSNRYHMSDLECSQLQNLNGTSVWETAGLRVLHVLGNQGLTVAETCHILHKLSMERALALLKGPEPLVITEQPAPLTRLMEGQRLVLRCGASGFPYPSYRWHQLFQGSHRKLGCIEDTLIISGVSFQHGGDYLCQVFNSLGHHLDSDTSRVIVSENPAITQGRAIEHRECSPSIPTREAPWNQNLGPAGEGCEYYPEPAGAAGPAPAPPLLPPAGPPTCSGDPLHGEDNRPGPRYLEELPQPQVHPRDIQVEIDAAVQLHCQALGQDLRYCWMRNNEPLDRMFAVMGQNTPNLHISKCQLFHDGKYSCMVLYPGGARVQSDQARLHVYDASSRDMPEFFRDLPVSESKCIGDELILRVAVRCGQPMTYQWFFKGKKMLGETSPTLQLTLKSLDAEGIYQCCITTETGIQLLSRQTRLKVDQNPCLHARFKVALLLGNSDYSAQEILQLPTVRNDVRLIEAKLQQLGFKVISLVNLEKLEMQKAILEFCELLDQGVYGVFMFSGHGFEVDRGDAYLVSYDSAGTMPPKDCVSMKWVEQQLQKRQPALLFIILDICRERPEGLDRNGVPDLLYEPPIVLGNTIIYYATSHGKQALEGKIASNSVFVTHLSKVIHQKCDIRHLFTKVLDELKNSRHANKIQFPELSHNLKESRMLADPINTTGHTQEMNILFKRWNDKNVLPERMIKAEPQSGVKFELKFHKLFHNVMLLDICCNQNLENFASLVDQVPPEINMIPNTRGGCVSYVIEALQKLRTPLDVRLKLQFTHRGRPSHFDLPLKLEWPLVASSCRPMHRSSASHRY